MLCKKGSNLLWIFLLLPLLTECKIKSQLKMLLSTWTMELKHFKPGVVAEALPDAIYYNKYIPLVFQLKVPEWSSDSLHINSQLHCLTPDSSDYYCPVAYHFERLLAPLAESMRFSKNIYSPTEGWNYFGKINCEFIQPHFSHLSAASDELHLYVDKFKATCPLAKDLMPVIKNISSGASIHVTQAVKKFYELVEKAGKIGSGGNKELEKLVSLTGFIGLQTANILTKFMDTIRWSDAFESCQGYKLNIGLVHSFMLQSALGAVKRTAEEKGYKLSIPMHEFLPHYYKLPIADCVLGVQNSRKITMMIRVLVPIQKKSTKYTRVRLTKIPYLVTEGDTKKLCEIDSFDPNDDFLIEESYTPGSKPIITTAPDCFEDDLCHVAEQPRRVILDPCLKGLMNNSREDVKNYCSFECYSVEHEAVTLPVIIKVDTNQYSITGAPPSGLSVKVFCDNKEFQTLEPNRTNGIMQIFLPCNCDIRYKSEIYKSTRPCDEPYAAHYLSTMPFKVVYPAEEYDHSGTHHDPSGSTEKYDRSEIPSQLVPADWVLPVEVVAENKTIINIHEGHGGQFAMIWILILLLLGSNFILFYIAYCNNLFSFEGVRELGVRFGIGTSSPPRNRLEEENNRQNSENSQWPVTLNRL